MRLSFNIYRFVIRPLLKITCDNIFDRGNLKVTRCFDTVPAPLYDHAFTKPSIYFIRIAIRRERMSVYDSKDLMSFNAASREFDVPVMTLELAASQGALRVIEQAGGRWLLRPDVEQFIKRMIKRGAGNKVVTRINP